MFLWKLHLKHCLILDHKLKCMYRPEVKQGLSNIIISTGNWDELENMSLVQTV